MIGSSWTLWAVDDEAAKVSKAVRDPNFLWNSLILIGVLLLTAFLISLLQKWRNRQLAGDEPLDQLTSFRALYEAGELSGAEYEQIKRRLARGKKAGNSPLSSAKSTPDDPDSSPTSPGIS
jgi:hypothetical protein